MPHAHATTRRTRWIAAASAAGMLLIAAPAAQAVSPAPGLSSLGHSAVLDAEPDQAHLTLSRPLAAGRAIELARRVTRDAPVELLFRSGEWSGGIVVADHSRASLAVVRMFVRTSPAASGRTPITGINGGLKTLSSGALKGLRGSRTARSDDTETGGVDDPGGSEVSTSGLPDRWVNDKSDSPSLPAWGILRQARLQGLVESTTHTIKGLGKYGYPALVHTVDMTQGHGGWIKPKYIYEHDYKIKKNGYVGSDPSYSWSSNLPGAYRDTRARGLEGGDDELDFTIGSVFTWLLDASKAYTITTQVAVNGSTAPNRSSAKLTASAIPNDGGFSMTGAAAGSGCRFVVDPSDPDLTPTRGNGDLAWCGGIGDFVHPSSITNISLIKRPDFPIVYTGTCYKWVFKDGYDDC